MTCTFCGFAHLRSILATAICFACGLLGNAHAVTLLESEFNVADNGPTGLPLGPSEIWSSHGVGAPDINVSSIQDGIFEVLRMHSSSATSGFRGIQTTTPISLVGLYGIRVEVILRPINQGANGTPASAGIALLGSTGAFVQASAGNNQPESTPEEVMDWADFWTDSLGVEAPSVSHVHCDSSGCDGRRKFVLTVTAGGTQFRDFSLPFGSDPVEVFSATSDLTISDLSDLTVALRQSVISGADQVTGDFDSILITSIDEVDGDYNGDLLVNAADYTVWRDLLGQTGAGLAADGNGDDQVDQADYTFWKEQFGNSAGAGSAVLQISSGGAVVAPEPASFLLAGCAMVMPFIFFRH